MQARERGVNLTGLRTGLYHVSRGSAKRFLSAKAFDERSQVANNR